MIIKETFAYIDGLHPNAHHIDFRKIIIKKTSHEMRVLSQTEEKNLNSVLLQQTDRYKLGVLICLYTGIRIGELCALRWKNISLRDQTIKIDSTVQRLQKDEKVDCSSKTMITCHLKSNSIIHHLYIFIFMPLDSSGASS